MRFLQQLASPKYFAKFANTLIPWLGWSSFLLFVYGLISALLLAPADYQQGNAFRIIYIHVPSAVMSLLVYGVMTICAIIFLVWKIKLADMVAKTSASLGASFTFLALVTGSLWGKPMWGTWWIWDARLTSELILLFLYFGIIALRSAISENMAAAKACSILILVGSVDLPIIHYSVYWWNTLHQQATLLQLAKPSIAPTMLYPLLIMLLAFFLYYVTLVLVRVRNMIVQHNNKVNWINELNNQIG